MTRFFIHYKNMSYKYTEECNYVKVDGWKSPIPTMTSAKLNYFEYLTDDQQNLVIDYLYSGEKLIATDGSEWIIIGVIATTIFKNSKMKTEIELIRVGKGNKLLSDGKAKFKQLFKQLKS